MRTQFLALTQRLSPMATGAAWAQAGYPAQRLESLAKGESEPAVTAQDKEQSNCQAEIKWR